MFSLESSISIRSESSYQFSESALTDRSVCLSMDSARFQSGDVSETIKQLILEEKRKNFVCKTDVSYKPQNLKRFHSLTMIHSKKQSMTLPIHLQRLLHASRKCPNIATNDILDAVYGAFFGFLIGDIVGAHIAYKVHSLPFFIPQALLMNGGGTYNLGPGQGTEQTQLLFSACYGLIQGKGVYNKGLMAQKYLKWIETKPFNVSAIFLLAINEIKKRKTLNPDLSKDQMGQILVQSSIRNKNQQSNLGLIRVLPLVIWGLDLDEKQFHTLIRDEMTLICPNQLVIETAIVFGMTLRTIIKTKDHQLAFHQAARWVYSRGSQRLRDLWKYVQYEIVIQAQGNVGKLKTSFTYAATEIGKKQVKFMDSLLKTLLNGGQADANCAIVMTLIGAIVGYNQIPSYFKQKINNFRMTQSSRPRNEEFTPYKVIEIVQNLLKYKPTSYVKGNKQFFSTQQQSDS